MRKHHAASVGFPRVKYCVQGKHCMCLRGFCVVGLKLSSVEAKKFVVVCVFFLLLYFVFGEAKRRNVNSEQL